MAESTPKQGRQAAPQSERAAVSAPEAISAGRLATAAVAAWALPGAGHVLTGQRNRGIILGCTIMGLWLMGLLIGGASVVNPRQDSEWFLRQIGHRLMAPSVVLGWVDLALRMPPGGPEDHEPLPTYLPSFGRVREQGLLFTGLAGFLNLLVIADVIFADPRRPSAGRPEPSDTPPAPPEGAAP